MIVWQRTWDSIRRLKRFAIGDLARDAEVARVSATAYVRRLEAAGFVKCVGTRPRKAAAFGGKPLVNGHASVVYALARDIGSEAPQVDAAGAPVRRGRGHDQMWRAMKMIGEFTCRELAINASTEQVKVDLDHARHYVRFLRLAGYLALVQPGKAHHEAVYRLARNTGARAPIVGKLPAVFDPNLGKIVWQGTPR